jgi:hypothetical protein
VNDSPKRSVGETISQLVVIAILIAILVVAIIFLRQFISSHGSDAPTSPTRSTQVFAAAPKPSVSNRSGEASVISFTTASNERTNYFDIVTASQHDSYVTGESPIRSRS